MEKEFDIFLFSTQHVYDLEEITSIQSITKARQTQIKGDPSLIIHMVFMTPQRPDMSLNGSLHLTSPLIKPT